MLTILEIILTIAAWRKGWRWRALLPGAIMMFFAFFLGAAIGASGGSGEDALGIFVLLSLTLMAVLIAMSVWAPKSASAAVTTAVAVHSETQTAKPYDEDYATADEPGRAYAPTETALP